MLNNTAKLNEEEKAIGHKLTDGLLTGDHALTWYVLRSATRQEKRAEACLIDAGIAVYVPRLCRWTSGGKDRVKVERPLFDGYLFAGLAPEHTLYGAEEVEGVYGAVRFSREVSPRPVPFGQIHRVLKAELAGEFDKTSKIRKLPQPGERVAIIAGQFQGFPAEFVRLRADERIEILFQMFGRWSPLSLKAAEVSGFGADDDAN